MLLSEETTRTIKMDAVSESFPIDNTTVFAIAEMAMYNRVNRITNHLYRTIAQRHVESVAVRAAKYHIAAIAVRVL